MKITNVHAYLQQEPLIKPYTIAYKSISFTELVFLEITLENGVLGIGAANPFAEVVGETPVITLHHLQSAIVAALVGRDIRDIDMLIDEAIVQFPNLPGTQAAIDIALHDAYCRFLGIPLVDLYGRKILSLPTSITIGIKEKEEALEEAKAAGAAGFRILKIKTGLDPDLDAERVALIKENMGDAMIIRVDANQGYTAAQLNQFISASSNTGIELIEQPLPAGNEKALLAFDEDTRKCFVADESLLDAASAMQWAKHPQPYGVFNIKLMKCGGIKNARKIAAIAGDAGISLFWGCNDESLVSITAALHTAFSCPNTKYLDLDGSFDIKEKIKGGFVVKDGWMRVNDKPGLGLNGDV